MNATPDAARATQAAQALYELWKADAVTGALPEAVRPRSRAEGYAVQAALRALHGGSVPGWKIAATSVAGQRHIVVFTFRRALDPRPQPWSREEVLAEVAQVLPGIEIPDSRFLHFEQAGEAQLIADCACCNDMVLGTPLRPQDRLDSLADLVVQAEVSDGRRPQGIGRNALGDPVEALRWFVNEMSATGQRIEADHFLTTGACVTPIPVEPGHRVQADFGWLGQVQARFS